MEEPYQCSALRGYNIPVVPPNWMIHPTESVVESMTSAVQEVLGVHRQMDDANAAKELQVERT